ncbi:unnamed protein product, partial [Discosporangium mesarthrocarpum]
GGNPLHLLPQTGGKGRFQGALGQRSGSSGWEGGRVPGLPLGSGSTRGSGCGGGGCSWDGEANPWQVQTTRLGPFGVGHGAACRLSGSSGQFGGVGEKEAGREVTGTAIAGAGGRGGDEAGKSGRGTGMDSRGGGLSDVVRAGWRSGSPKGWGSHERANTSPSGSPGPTRSRAVGAGGTVVVASAGQAAEVAVGGFVGVPVSVGEMPPASPHSGPSGSTTGNENGNASV